MIPQEIPRSERWKAIFFPALLMVVWVLQSLLIDPRGEFPLNDDWVYSRPVFILFREHRFSVIDWQVSVTFLQVLWGWLVSCFTGFSMTALRVSVVFLGGVTVLLSYALFREFHKDRFPAFFAALLIAINPVFLVWSHSFMTDVPFFTLSTAAFLFAVRWLKDDRLSDAILFILCACLSALVRQLAIVIPVAVLAAVLVKRAGGKRSLGLAIASFAAVALTLWLFQAILKNTVGVPYMMAMKAMGIPSAILNAWESREFAQTLIKVLALTIFRVSVSLGFFVFPAILLTFAAAWPGMSRRAKIASVAVVLGAVIANMIFQKLIPIRIPVDEQTLRDFGIGPLNLSGVIRRPEAPALLWKIYIWWGTLGMGMYCALAGGFLFRSFRSGLASENGKQAWPFGLVFGGSAFYFFLLGITGHFDRYDIFYLPFLLLTLLCLGPGLSWGRSRIFLVIAFLMALGIGSFSVAGTHDYLAWNRVRWQTLRIMMKLGIPPTEIDGGYEFNGWYLYDPDFKKVPGKNWYWVVNDTYRLSFSPLPNYEVQKIFSYPKWLPYGNNKILLLQRVRPETTGSAAGAAKSVYSFASATGKFSSQS